jgi:hypothetical protein
VLPRGEYSHTQKVPGTTHVLFPAPGCNPNRQYGKAASECGGVFFHLIAQVWYVRTQRVYWAGRLRTA